MPAFASSATENAPNPSTVAPNAVQNAPTGVQNAPSAATMSPKLPHDSTAPRLIALGSTGAGKSTLMNRATTGLQSKRVQRFAEGAGALSETQEPRELSEWFLGRECWPVRVVDLPGLDDSAGAEVGWLVGSLALY